MDDNSTTLGGWTLKSRFARFREEFCRNWDISSPLETLVNSSINGNLKIEMSVLGRCLTTLTTLLYFTLLQNGFLTFLNVFRTFLTKYEGISRGEDM